MTSHLIVRATMILATAAWAVGEALMRRSAALDRAARAAWTIGAGLSLIHVILAFQWVYGWNHAAAVEATVTRAADLFGVGWRGAVFLNYAFIALWLGDVCWWWVAPGSRSLRSSRLENVRRAFFIFMFVNGSVVFASGAGRVIGVAAVALVLAAWVNRPGRAATVAR
jgi:hypothetical protein